MHTTNTEPKKAHTSGMTLDDGRIVELIYDESIGESGFAVSDGKTVTYQSEFVDPRGLTYVPTSPHNNLLKHDVILFPRRAAPYGSQDALLEKIVSYIHTYVDVTPELELLLAHYVLLTWVYDAFSELPYVRFRGDFGSGKTRALKVIGAICYKPIFASGASTVSPIFHMLNAFRGTLIFDEADFRFSDEKAELSKILNNGNVRGFPVLRAAVTASREYDPRAFHVFGPKLVAMRGSYDDRALESRFITGDMGTRGLRSDIPISLPNTHKEEARTLRDMLLSYRFEMRGKVGIKDGVLADIREARVAQIFAPLASLMERDDAKGALHVIAHESVANLSFDRAHALEGKLLAILVSLFADAETKHVSVDAITSTFVERHQHELSRPVTHRFIGSLLRNSLGLSTYKAHSAYVVAYMGDERLKHLCNRYGVSLPETFVPR